jgi:LmbE family N-acetylglucosaminyl deacetylase
VLRTAPCVLFGLALPASLHAQALQPATTGGAVVLAQELRFLGHNKRVLMIGAHPDDEYTELLTLLARGMGAEAAYLSLNRGEGGQNLIGSELGELLGVLRTGELLASRQVDGARQYFTRAYDFGFSKNLEDTWAHWPKDTVLKDVVRIIRQFQPQIIVSVFSGTPRDGHGQHQAAGWAALEAFKIAGDSTRFPDAGKPWAPLKLYRSARFDSAGTTLVLQGGGIDPAVGQSYRQIAAKGRSFHRSQDMGQLQEPGRSPIPLQLVEDRTGGRGGDLFAGIDTTLSGIGPGRRPLPMRDVEVLERMLIGPLLTADQLQSALTLLSRIDPENEIPALQDQRRHLTNVYLNLRGIQLDAWSRRPRVTRGQPDTVFVVAWNTSDKPFDLRAAAPYIHQGIVHQNFDHGRTVNPGDVGILAIPYSGGLAELAQPYFLRAPRTGDMYAAWCLPQCGAPFEDPAYAAAILISDGHDEPIWVEREVVYRTNDQARGEVREPILSVPALDVKLEPASVVWRTGDSASHTFTVTVVHNSQDVSEGTVELELPRGWGKVAGKPFRLSRDQERQVFTFTIRNRAIPSGSYQVKAAAIMGKLRESTGITLIAYPHVRTREILRSATADVRVAPLTLPLLRRIGYVRGAADRVPEALEQAGFPITLLTGRDIETRSLAAYQAIVIGPRAFETDPDLPAANDQLLAYARSGGLVLTQYQQYGYFLYNMAPYGMTVGGRTPGTTTVSALSRDTTRGSAPPPAATIPTALLGGHDRVTDENAAVTAVDGASPMLRIPNRITAADWEGWVQERGLYFARSWDKEWKPVLSMHDPGETPLEGGLLVSKVGKGTYVYTGLSFFRQLPAGVPGAFRLFANLLALATPAGR